MVEVPKNRRVPSYKKLEKRLYFTFKQQIVWLISTAFGIAAALVWKDTITEVLNRYINPIGGITGSIYISVIFTLIAIFIIWIVNEIFKNR